MEPLGPGSVTWRVMADARTALCGGRALLLQVAHPAVGAGVAQHSDFRADPWPRLWSTVNSALRLTYGGPRAAGEAARLRELHRDITGVDSRGRRYHALNPAAYFWVHATLLDSAITAWEHFAAPLTEPDQATLYEEWRGQGLLLGLRPHQMPGTLPEFRAYVAEMVENTLQDNDSVRDVLRSLTGDIPPPTRLLPGPLWRPLRARVGAHLELITVGTLPPALRDRLGLPWTPAHQETFDRRAARVRRTVSALPPALQRYPAATVAYRRSSRS